MSREAEAAWLRLTLIPGIGGETQRKLLAAFGPPPQIFAAARSSIAAVVGRRAADLLLDHDTDAAVAAALAWCAEAGQRALTLADTDYPRALLDLPDPPTLLYVRGDASLLQRPALAIVGSRNATPQGGRDAEAFAAALAARGWVVVSGLALGIDAAAHRGALGTGATVAVVGTGADRIYPARNERLARDIAAAGAIVSEFPLGTPPLAANFPRRNRIISGLARGVLVVEAALESGSLITARLAGEQGREVFAIPGSIHSPQSRGCHRLLREGAKLVETAEDILEELGAGAAAAPAVPGPTEAAAAEGGDEGARLLALLGFTPCAFDALVAQSGLTPERLSVILLQLELEGRIAALPGGRYQRLAS